jgi:putative intracellular protease/amidase
MRRVLVVTTSHDRLGRGAERTGVWLASLATAYWQLTRAGLEVHLSSISGGPVPVDTRSYNTSGSNPDDIERFLADALCQQQMACAPRLRLLSADRYDALFLPGGHGCLWDHPACKVLGRVIESMLAAGRPVAALCHGAAGLLAPGLRGMASGHARQATAFTTAEERAVGLDNVVPLLLEDELPKAGVRFVHRAPFAAHTASDGNLLTGQNPASTRELVEMLIGRLSPSSDRTAGTRGRIARPPTRSSSFQTHSTCIGVPS